MRSRQKIARRGTAWIEPIATSVGATVLVTDDADGFKTVADGSLGAIGVSPQQAAADLTRLGGLVRSRQREQAMELEALHRRYLQACPPQEGAHQSLAYRLRLLFLDRLPPLASLDALPHLERAQEGNARWYQQCL